METVTITVTKEEQALIAALRATDEPPANVVLYYTTGLEDAAHRIEHIDLAQANISMRRASTFRQIFWEARK